MSENVYGVRFNLSICLDSNGPCEVHIEVFDEHRLNKPSCNWTRGFAIEGKLRIAEYILHFIVYLNKHFSAIRS